MDFGCDKTYHAGDTIWDMNSSFDVFLCVLFIKDGAVLDLDYEVHILELLLEVLCFTYLLNCMLC